METNAGIQNPWLRAQQALADEWFANLRRAARWPMVFEQQRRVQRGATPSEIVYEEDHLKLLHYVGDGPPKYRTPLVFVFALVNRPYILDILPQKSVVGHFVRAGFDTYMVDWGVPSAADRHRGLEDYIDGYMPNIMKFLRHRTGVPQSSVLGYCMGGTMSAMYTAIYPKAVKNLILMAAGIDYANGNAGLLGRWTEAQYFDVDAFVQAYGNCPADFLQAMFVLLKPVSNLIEKKVTFAEKMEDEGFVDEYLTMESWLNDNVPVPGEIFRQFVKYLYQQNRLAEGRMRVGRHNVDLRRITCPILNIVASQDDLVPPMQSEPFNDLVGSEDRTILKQPSGHVGLAMGTRAQKELWPKAVEWLAARS